ncbi:MAG: hypothetical protein HFG41_10820 [Coprococcus sp.]|nr:hypothetical protein [Coprococcus sp.]
MYDGEKAAISMIQYFKDDKELDETEYQCTVIEYQKDLEQVHLLMNTGKVTDISLDAVYECRIQGMAGEAVCNGIITERYINRAGIILILQVMNGFYEINIK